MECISKIKLCLLYGSLWVGHPGDRISVGREIFRARPDRPLCAPRLLFAGYLDFFLGVKRSGREIIQPPLSCAFTAYLFLSEKI
jgi:hypothetical protein